MTPERAAPLIVTPAQMQSISAPQFRAFRNAYIASAKVLLPCAQQAPTGPAAQRLQVQSPAPVGAATCVQSGDGSWAQGKPVLSCFKVPLVLAGLLAAVLVQCTVSPLGQQAMQQIEWGIHMPPRGPLALRILQRQIVSRRSVALHVRWCR